MKTYKIVIAFLNLEFFIQAENIEDARIEAKRRFNSNHVMDIFLVNA